MRHIDIERKEEMLNAVPAWRRRFYKWLDAFLCVEGSFLGDAMDAITGEAYVCYCCSAWRGFFFGVAMGVMTPIAIYVGGIPIAICMWVVVFIFLNVLYLLKN